MIAGGWNQHDNITNIVEIVDLINPNFALKWNDDRAARIGSIGGILQNQPFICGGRDSNWKHFNNGIILGSNQENPLINGRRFASSVVLNETRLLVTGGWDEKWKELNSEFISLDQPPEDGPKLPFTVSYHNMVQVDSTSIYLIGGWQDYKKSEKTWIIDAKNNFAIKEGPPMNTRRISHSSATMRLNNKVFIIVVGGFLCRSHTEILDTSLPTNKWKTGK